MNQRVRVREWKTLEGSGNRKEISGRNETEHTDKWTKEIDGEHDKFQKEVEILNKSQAEMQKELEHSSIQNGKDRINPQ